MNRRSLFVAAGASATLLALPGSRTASAATLPANRRARRAALFAARNWVSRYVGLHRQQTIDELKRFDLIDFDADQGNFDSREHAREVVAELREDRRLVVSYLNIGAAETFRWYWDQAKAFKRDPYEGWPGEFWMDVREPGWHDVIVNTVAPVLERSGVDGFFLDNIDVAGRYPGQAVRAGVVELVRKLRARFPQHVIIGQSYGMEPYLERGDDGRFFYQYLDGTSKEEVNATYDGGYRRIPKAESNAMLAELREFRDRGLYVGVLDYALKPEDMAYCIRRSTASGLLPFVSNRNLNRSHIADAAEGPARPGRPNGVRITDGVQLAWRAARDDMGVSRYDIRRNGKIVGYSRLPEFLDTGAPDAKAAYAVRAWDTGLHASPWSTVREV
jgi:cysteinyl-tRNA synthetase